MTGNSERSSRGDEGLREEVIKNVRSLLISARNGLTVAELQKDYNDMVKKPLPFRELGYKTPLDMLKDMPNVARPTWENGILILKGIADAATRHIASLVERQKKTSPKRKTRLTTYRPESLPVVPHFIRTQIKELLSSYPSGLLGSMFCIAFNRRFGQELNYSTLRFQSLGHLLESIPDVARIEDMKGQRGFRVYGRGVDVNLGVKTVDPGDSFPSRTKSSPTFAQTTMERRNSKPTPDVNDNNHGNKIKEATSSIKLKLDKRSGIDEKIQDECKQVLVKRPNGVWAARFATEYKKLHNKELNIKQLGFMSMVEFMSAMPDVVRIERPTKIDWLLFLAKDADIDHSESNGEVSVPVETGKKDLVPLLHPSLPGNPLNLPDGVGRGTYFSKIKPPECGYIEVCVTHVMDPHRFWVMMIENWPKLQALTEDIRQFYSTRESSRYRMPDWFVSVGQACCALYEDGSWYRGLVVGIHSVESIEVFYVDYGNKARLPLSSLRVLRSQFMKLPAQALPSKLAYIKPFDGGKEWSAGAIHRFYHLTKNYKNLVGLVCGVKEEVLSLCLCDTNESEDLHINDELVSEEYATCPEINSPETPSPDGQDQNRNGVKEQQQELITQNVPMQLTLEQQMYLKQHAINVQPLLSDIPAYPQDITSWLNQTAPYTNHFVNSQLNYSSSNMAPYVAYKDDLSFVEEINQELELNMPSNEGIVKRIKVANDFVFHVIKFEEKPYLISAEISALFWDSDLLRSMLRQKKKTLAKVVVSFAENKELFEVLIRCNIPGVSDGEEPRSFVTLYELEGVPEILKTFDHPSEELLTDFLAEINCFKKEKEDYWLVEKEEEEELKLGSEATSSSEDQFLESELGIDELQLLLQAMQFRRKRILQGLMTGGHCTDSTGGTVDELQEVEIQIEGLRQEILVKERKI